MVNIASVKDENTRNEPPDIFLAAKVGDLIQLRLAQQEGQSLLDLNEFLQTPLHVAAEHGQISLIAVIAKEEPTTTHIVDGFGYRPYDYSEGRSDEQAMAALSEVMYPKGQTLTVEF